VSQPVEGDEEDTYKDTAMANFLVLARGTSINTARVVAVSADGDLVRKFISELADENGDTEQADNPDSRKPLRHVTSDDE
jgi:hypothetical protein